MAAILQRCSRSIVENWLARVKKNKDLNHVSLTDKERTGYLPRLIEDLIVRLTEPITPGKKAIPVVPPPPWRTASCENSKAIPRRCWCTTHEYCR